MKTSSPWTFAKVIAGQWWLGHKAGDHVGVYVHHMGASKPCRALLTDGKLACPGCSAKVRVQWLGYVPVYQDTGKPVVVGVKEYAEEEVASIPNFAPVRVSRGKSYHDPVTVVRHSTGSPLKSARPERQLPADIKPWLLLTLWKDIELAEYIQGRRAPAPEPVPVVAPLPEPVAIDPATEELRRLMQSRRTTGEMSTPEAVRLAAEINSALHPLVPREQPSKNGVHKKKTK